MSKYNIKADIRLNKNGIPNLYYKNEKFTKHNAVNQKGEQRWACSKSNSRRCKAVCTTKKIRDHIMMHVHNDEHNHGLTIDYNIKADIRLNKNGIQNLYYKNQKFTKHNAVNQKGEQRWACSKSNSRKCKAVCTTKQIKDHIMMHVHNDEHNHELEYDDQMMDVDNQEEDNQGASYNPLIGNPFIDNQDHNNKYQMTDVKEKVALVTGGATGLGRAFCEELLRHGAKVSICDLDSDGGKNAADEMSKTFGKHRVLFCHCDVTDYVQFEEAFQTTINEFDSLDIVVNNAEIMNDKFWELEVDVNLNGTIRGLLLGLQFLGKDKGVGHGGCIINIGSSVSFRPQISRPIYSATKHAILALSKSCGDSYHFNLTGVRVVALCVGLLQSEASSSAHGNRFTSLAHEKAWQLDMRGVYPQKIEHVAKSLISIIKDSTSGSIWLVANEKPAKEIAYSSCAI